MVHRSFRRWVVLSLTAAFLLLSASGIARSLTVEGTVRFDDGAPVKGGTVILTELTGAVGQMPGSRPLAVAVSDRNGKFHANLNDVRGVIDVSLVRDHCDWTPAVEQISEEGIGKKDHFELALIAKHDHCEGRSP